MKTTVPYLYKDGILDVVVSIKSVGSLPLNAPNLIPNSQTLQPTKP
jgi:hypothetical protein